MTQPHLLLALALNTLVGLSLGLLGGGGSILAVPILVYVARVDAREAIGLSLAIVGATSLTAAGAHARSGRVDLRIAGLFGAAGMAGAWAGAHLTSRLSGRTLLLLFALLMLVVGALMLRPRPAAQEREGVPRPLPVILLAGAGVGVLTGFLGVGGGFLIVPALVLLAGLPMPRAVGTSLLVIALSSAAGFLGHVGEAPPRWALALALTATAVGGALVGARLAGRLSATSLRRAFAVLVLLVGLLMLARNLTG